MARGRSVSALGGMKAHLLTSSADNDWLSMRLALWPDCPRDQHLEEMAAWLKDPTRYANFIAKSADGQALGFAEASIRKDYVNGTETSPVGYLEGLFVWPEARNQGVARLLIEAVSEWAAAKGCTELASDTQPENVVSQKAHVRLGFVETERAVFFSRRIVPKHAA